MLPPKFQFVWLSSFKGEDSLEIDKSETRIACGGLFANRLGQNEQSSVIEDIP